MVVSFLGCHLQAQQKRNIRQEQKAFSRALSYADADDYESAIEVLNAVLQSSPDFLEAYLQLGLCYLNTNTGADAAIRVLNKGLMRLSDRNAFNTLHDDMLLALGEAYQVSLQPDSALAVYRILLAKTDVNDTLQIEQIKQQISRCENAKVFLTHPVPLAISNLGEKVNSKYDDHSPLMNDLDQMLLFTSRRADKRLPVLNDGQSPEKIYCSTRVDGDWEPAHLFNVFFKNQLHESGLSLSPDGTNLFIYRSDDEGKSIYVSSLESGIWTPPVRLPYPINTPGNETHASLSADGSTLFFTSDREGGFGGLDIYMCKKDVYGSWGKVRNLGPSINTEFDEETSMIHPDGYTLYFSSEGHNSMGRLDVFYSQMNADSTWLLPVNLGYPINTPDDDFFFLPNLDKSHAYYASSHLDDNFGGSDIYKVEFDAASDSQLAVIEGWLSPEELAKGPLRIMVTRLADRRLVGDYRPNEQTGQFTMFLQVGYDYAIEKNADLATVEQSLISIEPHMAYRNSALVYSFDQLEMTPPLERVLSSKTLVEQNSNAVIALEQDIKQIQAAPYYTVQVLALKRTPLFASFYLRGLNLEDIQVVKCKDGFTRYLYGVYHGSASAKESKNQLKRLGRFEDAFVRPLSEITELEED
ncbi:tetratricopeptide repeat protein [Carboxylicivirga taeanensis]|uniref:tetratricopeptide repeat protein n=1 Tax=Carboxylicivirga taeanensis TaxID=1416875 RepID=UPI003F6DC874